MLMSLAVSLRAPYSALFFYLIYYDIDTVCHSSTKLKSYADDLKLYSVAESVGYGKLVTFEDLYIMFLSGLTHGSSINTIKTPVLNLNNTQSLLLQLDLILSKSGLVSFQYCLRSRYLTDSRLLFKVQLH
jgi:hypothetical protein